MTGDWPAISGRSPSRSMASSIIVASAVSACLDNVVDHENLGVRQGGDRPPDVLRAGGNDLNLGAGKPPDFVDEEEVRRLGDGDRQHAADQKQRQHKVFLGVLPRQHVDHLRVQQPGVELGIRHAVFGGQTLDHLVLGAILLARRGFRRSASCVLPASAARARTASRRG